jgi:hypothetical protein
MMTFLFVVMTAISFIFGYYIGHKMCETVANKFLTKYISIIINDLHGRQELPISYVRQAIQAANNAYGMEIISIHQVEE